MKHCPGDLALGVSTGMIDKDRGDLSTMRFHYGAIPENQNFLPEAEGWRTIREPDPMMLQVIAIPVAVVLVLLWALLVFLVLLLKRPAFHFPTSGASLSLALGPLVLMLLLFIPGHELLHALVHPGWGLSANTVLGLWLTRGLFYAHYEGAMSRNRFLLVFVMPYLVLGILPIVVWGLWPGIGESAEMTNNILVLSLLGSVAACGDFVGVGLIVWQIPSSAIVRNKGWKTYWKPAP